MNKNSNEVIYKIHEFSFSLLLTRIITIGVSIYFILNFNNNPSLNGIIILFLGFITFIATEKKTITATKFGIEIKEYNLLNVFTKKDFIRFKDVSIIEFTPSKFSFIAFLLNGLIRTSVNSTVSSTKESVLKIKMKNGKEIVLNNIGNKLDAKNLNKIIIENK